MGKILEFVLSKEAKSFKSNDFKNDHFFEILHYGIPKNTNLVQGNWGKSFIFQQVFKTFACYI